MKTAPGPIGRIDKDENRVYVDPSNPDVVLDSVTTVLSATEEKVQLRKWVARLTAEFAVDHQDYLATLRRERLDELTQKFVEEFDRVANSDEQSVMDKTVRDELVDFVKAEAKRLQDTASEMGTYQHDVLEALLLDLPIPNIPNHLVDVEVDGEEVDLDEISDGLLNLHIDFKMDPLLAEATVANPAAGYAGTLDLVAFLPEVQVPGKKTKGALVLIDLKCGKNLYSSMRRQLAAYEKCTEVWVDHMGNKVAMPKVDFCAVAHLRKKYERGYKLIVVPTGEVEYARFLRAHQVYKDLEAAGSKLGGTVLYVPLPDGSQPPPLIEDIDSLGRARSALVKAGIRSITDLANLTKSEALALSGIADKTIIPCIDTLAANGLAFKEAEVA